MPRTIAVTGTASGLGRAIAFRLAAAGARVIGIDLAGADVSADLGAERGRAEAVRQVVERSENRLDGLVAAAGVGPYCDADLVTSVNYFGAMVLFDALLPALRNGEHPAAVSVASVGAFFEDSCVSELIEACVEGDEKRALDACRAVDGERAYVSTKRALIQAVRRRAPTWGPLGVRINALAPGNMRTPMLAQVYDDPVIGEKTREVTIPLGHDAEPEEVARAAVFLLGPDACYVHGTVLVADGGSAAAVFPDRV